MIELVGQAPTFRPVESNTAEAIGRSTRLHVLLMALEARDWKTFLQSFVCVDKAIGKEQDPAYLVPEPTVVKELGAIRDSSK